MVCQWHGPMEASLPALPKCLAALSLIPGPAPEECAADWPSVAEFCDAVKWHAGVQAKHHHGQFSRTALTVIATHVLATLCATLALAGHRAAEAKGGSATIALGWISGLLVLELALLVGGLGAHHCLHRAKSLRAWAVFRLVAELNRSVTALGKLHIYLSYQFTLHLPADLRPLLRTLNILHLRSTRPFASAPWKPLRDDYLFNRLTNPDPSKGQIQYYADQWQAGARRLRFANALFLVCSVLAILSTMAKLGLHLVGIAPTSELALGGGQVLGSLAIFLPTLAVGALSWVAAGQYKARVQSFGTMRNFLERQSKLLRAATSDREFRHLVEETEARLLNETAGWYFQTTVL